MFSKPTYISILTLFVAFRGLYGRAETLEQITTEALRRNPELQVFEQAIISAEGGVRTARTLQNPELSIAPGVRHLRGDSGSGNLFHAEAALSQLFKFPGKRALEIAIAQGNVELNKIAREGFRFQLVTKVHRAYYGLLTAEKIVENRRNQVESAKTFLESARKRTEAGYASDFETIKGEAELIAANRALLDAEGRVAVGRVTLNALMGRAPEARLEVAGPFTTHSFGTPPDYIALAMARNPAIRTVARQAELAGLTLRSTRFGRRPDFAIGPSIEYLDNEQTYGFGVTMALPLWDQKRGAIQTATAEQRRAVALLEKTRLEVSAEVAKASSDIEIAEKQLALYSPQFLEQLKSFMAQAEQGYTQSSTTLLIYLDAKRTYFDTQANYYEALGHVSENRAELESAIGVPLELKP